MGTQLIQTQTQVAYLFTYLFLCISKYTNLALEYHNLQLEAAAFREEFDPETFEDLTLPNYKAIHKVDSTIVISSII